MASHSIDQEELEKGRARTHKRTLVSKAEQAELKKHSRKQMIKRLREDDTLKAQLRNEIANFLIDINLDMIDCLEEEMRMLLRDGSYGYQRMRNKELIDAFSEMYRKLFAQGEEMKFYSTRRDKESFYYGQRNSLDEEESVEVRREYAQKAEELMCRLFEEAIKL